MIVLIDPKSERRSSLQDELGSDVDVEWVPTAGAMEGLLGDPSRQVETIVIGPGIDFEHALTSAIGLATRAADVGVVLWVEEARSEQLRRALKAGVLDVLDDTRGPGEMREAVDRGRARHRQLHHDVPEPRPDHDGGHIAVVFSTKGGCGKSVLATNLAIAVAQRIEAQVGLVDLDLQAGDLAIMLQLLPAWTLHDAALQGSRLDIEALHGFLTPHRSTVQLLAAPTDPALVDQIPPDAVAHLLGLMRATFPLTIVDSPAFFSDQVLAAIDVCDEVLMVGSLDVPSVKNLKLGLQTLEALGVGRDRIRLILNRADSSVGLRIQEVERSIGTHVDISVPSSREVPLSVNQGTPLVLSRKRSSVIGALEDLASSIVASLDLPKAESGPRRRFGRRQQEG